MNQQQQKPKECNVRPLYDGMWCKPAILNGIDNEQEKKYFNLIFYNYRRTKRYKGWGDDDN